jgi:hypothetical protein
MTSEGVGVGDDVQSIFASKRQSKVKTRRHPKRQKRTPSLQDAASMIVRLELPLALPKGWVVQVSMRVLWSHLLYTRGLLPLPVHQMLTPQTTTVSAAVKRKLSQTSASLDRLDSEYKMLGGTFPDIQSVLISLGPSFSRAKECYLIDASELEHPADALQAFKLDEQKLAKNEISLSRRLLRQLMEVEMEDCTCHKLASSYQLFVSFRVPSETATRLFEQGHDEQSNRFIIRHGFQCPPKRVYRHVKVQLSRETRETPGLPSPLSSQSAEGDHDHSTANDTCWISLRTSIKGFRL